jgi:hypothetical protein
MKTDATAAAASMSAIMLPNIATMTAAVTPPGRFIRIIYDTLSELRQHAVERLVTLIESAFHTRLQHAIAIFRRRLCLSTLLSPVQLRL